MRYEYVLNAERPSFATTAVTFGIVAAAMISGLTIMFYTALGVYVGVSVIFGEYIGAFVGLVTYYSGAFVIMNICVASIDYVATSINDTVNSVCNAITNVSIWPW